MSLLGRYRMLDLSRFLAGPYASHLLADMGMDVVKVEEPEARYGMARDVVTPVIITPDGERRASAYNSLARNKRSIALDLLREDLRPDSLEVFYRLVREADVVLEGYRPGVVKWIGIDYETLRRINPRIIMCSLSGYGQSGPYSSYAGHAPQYASVAGVVKIRENSSPDDSLSRPSGYVNGLFTANAILAALLEREETGEGQYIDVSMMGSLMSLTLAESVRYLRDGHLPRPTAPSDTGLSYLECKDGKFLSTSNTETVFWENFCKVLDRPQYLQTRSPRSPGYAAMVEDVKAIFRTKTRDEWLPVLWSAETSAAPVNDIADAFADPQVQHIDMVWNLDHPVFGPVRQLGVPAHFSRTPIQFERFAPILGEHTREILDDAGFSPEEMADLETRGVVKSWIDDDWAGGRNEASQSSS